MKLFFQSIVGIFSIVIAIYIIVAFYVKQEASRDNRKKSDVIMVLGAKSYINHAYNPCLYSRVEHAVELYKAHYANKILVSGGIDKEDHANEAKIMRQIAMDLGVPSQDILLESASSSTYENFVFSKKILEIYRLQNIIIVTEPFHILRAQLVAKKLGLSFYSSPAKQSICWNKNKYFSIYFLKEPLAIMMYKIHNKI